VLFGRYQFCRLIEIWFRWDGARGKRFLCQTPFISVTFTRWLLVSDDDACFVLLCSFFILFVTLSSIEHADLIITNQHSTMLRLLARSRCVSIRPFGMKFILRRTLCSPTKLSEVDGGRSTEKTANDGDEDSSSGDTKAVDIFMTAMRVLVVLGVVSSMSSNRRLMNEAREDDRISTDLERTIEIASESILKEEWRQPLKERIEKGEHDALPRALSELLLVTSSGDEDKERDN